MVRRDAPVVRLQGLTHRYGKVAALEGVSFDIPSNCTVGLIGPDGVGKSSLLGLIAGAKRVQAGRIEVLSGDIADARHRNSVCPRIAFMPQGLGKNLYPDLSVRENIEFFARLFGQSRAEREMRIAELLHNTGLASFADRLAKQLSGGMRQKLGLCCSLIHDPDLLILDEPTTGVDPLSRRQFWQLIERMRRRRPGMSVVVVLVIGAIGSATQKKAGSTIATTTTVANSATSAPAKSWIGKTLRSVFSRPETWPVDLSERRNCS